MTLPKVDIKNFVCTPDNYPNCRLEGSDIVLSDDRIERDGCYDISSELESGQTLNIYIPKTIKYKEYIADFCVAYAIYFLFLILVSLLSSRSSRELTKKFYELIEYIRSERMYLQSECETGIDIDDELFPVYSKLCMLVGEINRFHAEKERLMAENTKLQFEFAQAQINPHLLYNSLSVIKWDCLKYSAYDISDKIGLLADYYRASINKNESEYRFFNEVELIEKYIGLVSIIHGIEYKYTIDFDEALLQYHTIRHIFQPFVENAVLHGINRMQDGHILIGGYFSNNKITLIVKDNGCGIDKDKLEKVRNYESDNSESYGLRNTIRRIKLHYGEGSIVKIESEPNCGTKISIIIDDDSDRNENNTV